jgi:hypothetical protein
MKVSLPTALYRHFDCQGVLLYVGVTDSPGARWNSHQRNSSWAKDVDPGRTQFKWYPDRQTAEAAERAAINAERPLHNRVHAWRPPAQRAVRRRAEGAERQEDRHTRPARIIRPNPPELWERLGEKVGPRARNETISRLIAAYLNGEIQLPDKQSAPPTE